MRINLSNVFCDLTRWKEFQFREQKRYHVKRILTRERYSNARFSKIVSISLYLTNIYQKYRGNYSGATWAEDKFS